MILEDLPERPSARTAHQCVKGSVHLISVEIQRHLVSPCGLQFQMDLIAAKVAFFMGRKEVLRLRRTGQGTVFHAGYPTFWSPREQFLNQYAMDLARLDLVLIGGLVSQGVCAFAKNSFYAAVYSAQAEICTSR